MCLLSLQGRDKIIGVSTERPPRESSEIGGTAIKKTVTVSEHQVRLRCFPLTSIGKGTGCTKCNAEQRMDFLILEIVTPALCSGCSQGMKSCWAAPFCLCRPSLGHNVRTHPRKLPRHLPIGSPGTLVVSIGSIFCGSQCEMNISLTFPWACHPKSWWKATPKGSQSPPQGVLCGWVGMG